MCLQKQAPFSPDLTLIFQTPPVYWQETGHPVDEEGDRGPRKCVHLASEAHNDKGRPNASQRRGPNILRGAGPVLPGEPHTAQPRKQPPLPCHHGAEVQTPPFVNISFLFSKDLGLKYFRWPLESCTQESASRPQGKVGDKCMSQPDEWAAAQEAHRCL